jgi:DNA-binding PadR family transcriptional regulator
VLKLLTRRPRLHGSATGRRARIYELTAAGKKQQSAEKSRWQSVSLAINRALLEA